MNNEQSKSRPSHRIYSVLKNGNDKSVWTAIGAAWPNKDGKGFTLKYEALALPGAEIVLRLIEDDKQGGEVPAVA